MAVKRGFSSFGEPVMPFLKFMCRGLYKKETFLLSWDNTKLSITIPGTVFLKLYLSEHGRLIKEENAVFFDIFAQNKSC